MIKRRALMGGMGAVLAAPMVRAQSVTVDLAEAFLAKHGLPGLTWAIRRPSGDVLTGAAGYADPVSGEVMRPEHRMRIASISKPITAAMILTLEAEGSLSVAHRPLARDGILGHFVPTHLDAAVQAMLDEITIDHLLCHTAGGWDNSSFDPVLMFLGETTADLIKLTLLTEDPVAAAGTQYAYSNFGYFLLGRVIEAVVGVDCTASVWAWLADTAGATSFDRAGNTLADRLENEVVYVSGPSGVGSGDPYALNLSRSDSAMGYVVNAPDLLAILAGFDGFGAETVPMGIAARMADPWTPGGAYGRGLNVSPNHPNRWHGGGLHGTTTLAMMQEGGELMCVLCNGRTATSPEAITTVIWDIYNSVS